MQGAWIPLQRALLLAITLLILGMAGTDWSGLLRGKRSYREILPARLADWSKAVQSYGACILGDVNHPSFAQAILHRQIREPRYAEHIWKTCYIQSLVEPLKGAGGQERALAWRFFMAVRSQAAEMGLIPVGPDPPWARRICQGLVELRRELILLGADPVGAPMSCDMPLEEAWVVSPPRPVAWREGGGERVTLAEDGQGLLVMREKGGHWAFHKTLDGRTWETVELWPEAVFPWSALWRGNAIWGVGRSKGRTSLMAWERGKWHRRGPFPEDIVDCRYGMAERGQWIIVGRRISSSAWLILRSPDQGRRLEGEREILPRLAQGSFPTVFIEGSGAVTGLGGLKGPWFLVSRLIPPSRRATAQKFYLPGAGTRPGPMATCSSGNHRWILIEGSWLLASQDEGGTWEAVHAFKPPRSFHQPLLACQGEKAIILGGLEASPHSVWEASCNHQGCGPPRLVTPHKPLRLALRLDQDGASFALSFPGYEVLFHDRSTVLKVMRSPRQRPNGNPAALRVNDRWYLMHHPSAPVPEAFSGK